MQVRTSERIFLDLLTEPKKGPKKSTSPVASWTLRPQLNNLFGFGMEHPAGIAQDGYAERRASQHCASHHE